VHWVPLFYHTSGHPPMQLRRHIHSMTIHIHAHPYWCTHIIASVHAVKLSRGHRVELGTIELRPDMAVPCVRW
jgi:hypothetical protein